MIRRGEIRVPHPKIDDIPALLSHLGHADIHLHDKETLERLQPFRDLHLYSSLETHISIGKKFHSLKSIPFSLFPVNISHLQNPSKQAETVIPSKGSPAPQGVEPEAGPKQICFPLVGRPFQAPLDVLKSYQVQYFIFQGTLNALSRNLFTTFTDPEWMD